MNIFFSCFYLHQYDGGKGIIRVVVVVIVVVAAVVVVVFLTFSFFGRVLKLIRPKY